MKSNQRIRKSIRRERYSKKEEEGGGEERSNSSRDGAAAIWLTIFVVVG